MSVVLVTGAAGFIGSHAVDELIRMGHQVIALDDLSGGFVESINPDAWFIKASVVDRERVNRLFTEYCFDYVFHLAAYAAEGLSHFIKHFNYTNNLIGSVNLINASVSSGTVKCFVFTSSIAVYAKNQLPMSEDLQPQPEDRYGIAKYGVELDLHETYHMFEMPFIIFRPDNVYGERQNIGDRYRNVIGILMNQPMHDEPFTIFGDGEQTRAFTYIGDVAPVIAHSIERPEAYNQVFNVGADKPYTVNHVAKVVAQAMGVELRVNYLDARKELVHAYASHERIRTLFGDLTHSTSLEEGVARMADCAMRHGSRETKVFCNVEVSKNMPPSWASVVSASGLQKSENALEPSTVSGAGGAMGHCHVRPMLHAT